MSNVLSPSGGVAHRSSRLKARPAACRSFGPRRRNSDSLAPTIEASASNPSQRSFGNSDNVRRRAAPSSKSLCLPVPT